MVPARKLFRNYVILFAGNVLGQLLFFFGLTRLARVLGPAGFGVWNFAQLWMLYLLRAGEFGLEVVGIRETSRDPSLVGTWIATVVPLRFALALLLFGFALLVSAANLLPSGTTTLVLICALSVFPMAFLLEWVLEARQEVGLISSARVLKGLLFFLCVFSLVAGSEHAELAAFLYVVSLAIPGLVIFAIVVRRFGFHWSSFSYRRGLGALRLSAPIGVATLLSQYSLVAATMMVGYVLPKEELGYFTAAHRIVIFLWAYVITSMHRILLPSLSRSFHESLSGYQRFVERFFRLSALAAVPMGLLGTLCAGPLMVLLYSAQYESSGTVFAIVLWAFVLATMRSILEIGLIASDCQRRYMKGMAILAVTYTIVTPILTLTFGIIGAAASTVISEAVYFAYLVMSFPHTTPAALLKNTWKPLLAALVALVALHPLAEVGFVWRGMMGLALFVGVLVLTKGVTISDFALIRSAVRRDAFEPPT